MQQALIRLIVLSVLLINQFLITLGWNPLPFSEDQIFEAVSSTGTVTVAIYAWWKNNDVTKQAIHNDKFLKNKGMK